jgi:hypothetical protein
MKKPTEVTDIHIRELLAYELHRADQAQCSDENAAETWRNLTLDARASMRARAEIIMRRLEAYGLAMRASNSRKALDTLDAILTIPARPAYDLAEATEPISIKK